MVTINTDKVKKIVSHLEASSKALDCIKRKMESASSSPQVDEYYQILFVLTQVKEAKERLEKVIGNLVGD